uniref:Uncharacterized protein n=1 Tax=Neolamprologus brichardi TaxID=32507 RepID=A0A3Q4GQN7_NEOBR
ISKTCIITSDVPDLDGVPPSAAITVRFITGCFSLSSIFCKTSSLPLKPFAWSWKSC